MLGKSRSAGSSFPGLHELVRVTPNNWVRHGKLTEEMRPPLDFAAGWSGALLSVPSPGHPHPLPWLTHLHPKCHLQNVLEHRSCGFTHGVGAATGCFAPLCSKPPNHHLKFHGPPLPSSPCKLPVLESRSRSERCSCCQCLMFIGPKLLICACICMFHCI